MTDPWLPRLTAALTALAAVALVVADGSSGRGGRALLAGVALLLGVVGVLAWGQLALARHRERQAARRAVRDARATGVNRRTASGVLLVLAGVTAGLLALQAMTGIDFWALLLLAAGGAVLWSQVGAPDPDPDQQSGWQRLVGRRGEADPETDRMLLGGGIALVLLGALATLSSLGALTASRNGVLQTLVAVAVIAVVIAPFWRRMSRRAAVERSERIRGDERAEVAAHLHDSVLQTLALIQRRSDDPREVAKLARRQERELRLWLSGRSERPDDELMAALRAAAAAVEVEHAVEIEVVTSGEQPLDDRTAALVAAAREAMANAARHAFAPADGEPGGVPARGGTIQVYAEAEDGRVEVFVRDRGRGFDPGDVPGDRRGVRESIVGRMRRAGGRATIHAAPGEGTEVELLLDERKDRS
ncbi:sensor histidine kinase [Patulibacter defluvii]|uniref:sensor histidine kinase n=1 Tax=Patulibacter defluvii TaxID=3095358 RepID=UPI002A7561B6|nr:ATP-binding protein [Patulibacter sp. DM4]